MMEAGYAAPPEVHRFQQRALVVGVAGIALTLLVIALGLILNQPNVWKEFFRSYLLAFIFWGGIALGCLAILMVQHLSGGEWGVVIRRFLEAGTRTLPLVLAMFLPLVAGLGHLYVWTHGDVVQADEVLRHKQPYLNVPFFLVRAVIYFAIWLAMAYFLNKWSREQDLTGDKRITRRMQVLSGPGLVLFGGTVTFASVDWVMSLDPHWFSTIFGILFMGGQALAAMAFVIIVTVIMARFRPMSDVVAPKHFHDLGKLMLAFVMLWAYFSFSQFLIIWMGNLPEEIPWYLDRLSGGWRLIAGLIILFHFALPFVLLLPREANRNTRILVAVAAVVILMRYVDLYWLVGPIHHAGGEHDAQAHAGFIDYILPIVAPVGLGGIWVWFFIRQLGNRPLLPIQDPQLEDALSHAHE
jgi:hypothetical protein